MHTCIHTHIHAYIHTHRYYSASIIQMAGFDDNSSIWLACVPAFGNAFFTVVGLLLVDHLGRRKLLLISLMGVIVGFILLSSSFILTDQYTPPATPLFKDFNDSCPYTSCGSCVGSSQCGFCALYSNTTHQYLNGTCSPANTSSFSHPSIFIVGSNESCGTYADLVRHHPHQLADDYFSSGDLPPSTSQHRWFYYSCPNNHFAWLAIASLFIYIMFFAPGMGPLPWTINSEIYPTWARSTGIAIATSVNWIFNLIVSLTFLTIADALGQPTTFGVYAGLGFIGLILFFLFVPETKGTKLEEVEQLFQRPHFLSWCRRKRRYHLLKNSSGHSDVCVCVCVCVFT